MWYQDEDMRGHGEMIPLLTFSQGKNYLYHNRGSLLICICQVAYEFGCHNFLILSKMLEGAFVSIPVYLIKGISRPFGLFKDVVPQGSVMHRLY
jgi:hypothetical protein